MMRWHTVLALVVITWGTWAISSNSAEASGCCPPPPVCTTLCVNPPCSCCSENVSVCVPGCCVGPPQVCWRAGLLGRQIGTYTWPCCGHTVEVVVTRRGNVRVR